MKRDDLIKKLKDLSDQDYRDFMAPLIKTVDKDRIIGVRIPKLRRLEKSFNQADRRDLFQQDFYYLEELHLRSLVISNMGDIDRAMKLLDDHLSHVDNWASCDMIKNQLFNKDKKTLLAYVESWLESGEEYRIRYGIKALMDYFVKEDFSRDYALAVARLRSDFYYVNMMRAWYMQYVFNFYPDLVVEILKGRLMDKWTHNMTIQKIRDSRQVDEKIKKKIGELKREN